MGFVHKLTNKKVINVFYRVIKRFCHVVGHIVTFDGRVEMASIPQQ
jgi:hypothetical protein